MTGAANLFAEQAQALFMVGFITFLRVGPFIVMLPGIGERYLPVRVKLGLCLALTAVIAASLPWDVPLPPLELLIVSETLVGVFLGLFFRAFVWVLQIAGAIAAQSTSLAQLLGSNATDPLPAIGHILQISGIAMFFIFGVHLAVIEFFQSVYVFFPVGSLPSLEMIGQDFPVRLADAFAKAFGLAAPFVALSIMYNVTIGAINKAMPQLMVAFIGAPLITFGALLMLMLTCALMLESWLGMITGFLANPVTIIR